MLRGRGIEDGNGIGNFTWGRCGEVSYRVVRNQYNYHFDLPKIRVGWALTTKD